MKILMSLITLFIVGCSASGANNPDTEKTAETLYGYRWHSHVLLIDVMSTGCTKAEHFSLNWLDANTLVIQRDKADRCRKAANIKTLSFSTQRKPGQIISIKNPVKAQKLKQFAH